KFTVTAATGTLLKGSATGEFVGDNETQNITITLTQSGSISGTVTRNGSPVSGVSVTLTGSNFTLFAYSNASGQYQINGVPEGAYVVVAEDIVAGGRARAIGSIDTAGETDQADLALDSTAPTVVSTDPANNQSGVSNASTISVVFSEPMDSASLQGAF